MRILIPGGSGQVGTILSRHLHKAGHEVTVLSRHPKTHPEQSWRTLAWDGETPGPWAEEPLPRLNVSAALRREQGPSGP